MAVRRGTTHRLGREVAACTTAIFYHYGVSEALAEFLPDKAGDNVGDAAGGECDLQRDRLRRVGLRPWRLCATNKGSRQQHAKHRAISGHAVPFRPKAPAQIDAHG